jgi:hypothetical protein
MAPSFITTASTAIDIIKAGTSASVSPSISSSVFPEMQKKEAFQITIRALKDRATNAQAEGAPWRTGRLLGCLAELEEYLKQCEKDSFEGREELLLEMSLFHIKLKNTLKPRKGADNYE